MIERVKDCEEEYWVEKRASVVILLSETVLADASATTREEVEVAIVEEETRMVLRQVIVTYWGPVAVAVVTVDVHCCSVGCVTVTVY